MNDPNVFEDYYPYAEVPHEIKRDRWGRPLIRPAGASYEIAYTRASSLGEYATSSHGLHRWQQRLLTRGMGVREDLAALAAALPELGDNAEENARIKAELDRIGNEAMSAVGRDWKANYGTAVHGLVDGDGVVPERMKDDVSSYHEKMAGTTELLRNKFVACDALRSAGSFDTFRQWPGDELGKIVDVKTGMMKPHAMAVQLAVYANGELYDHTTHQRSPWPMTVDRRVGIIAHVARGEGKTTLYRVNLEVGMRGAREAVGSRDYAAIPAGEILEKIDPEKIKLDRHREVMFAISLADCQQTLVNIWEANKDIWSPGLTHLGQQRLATLRGTP